MTHLRLTIQKTPYQTTTKNRTTKQPPPPSSDEKPDSDAELVLTKTLLYIQYIYLYITHLVRPSRKVMHTTYIRIMANIYIYILVHLRRSADEPVASTDTTKLRTNEHVSIVVAAELPFTYTQLTRLSPRRRSLSQFIFALRRRRVWQLATSKRRRREELSPERAAPKSKLTT